MTTGQQQTSRGIGRTAAIFNVLFFLVVLVYCVLSDMRRQADSSAILVAPLLGFLCLLFWLWVLLKKSPVKIASLRWMLAGTIATFLVAPLQYVSVTSRTRDFMYGWAYGGHGASLSLSERLAEVFGWGVICLHFPASLVSVGLGLAFVNTILAAVRERN